MTRALDKEIQQYLPLLDNAEKRSLLSVIKSFLSLKNAAATPESIEEYNQELNEAEIAYEKGNYISHEELKKQIKQW